MRFVNRAHPFVAANPNSVSWLGSTFQSLGNLARNSSAKKTKIIQPAWCAVCKIHCNSNEVYSLHMVGKKHQKNLEKLGKPKRDISGAASIIGPVEAPNANECKTDDLQNSTNTSDLSQAPENDLETKKKKVLEGGAAADALRTCTFCNVVCNSQTVFNLHLEGQKHAAMAKKWQTP